jgi:hypothetical protein
MKTRFNNNRKFLSLRWTMINFLLLFLLLWLVGGRALFAQNGVVLSNLTVRTGAGGAASTLTINIRWTPLTDGTVWSDTVWVFVDYNNSGMMERLPLITSGATLTATSAPGVGKVIAEDGNNQGVWVVGNARSTGSFSATVQLLTATVNLGGACAYASNYPPVGRYTSPDEIIFIGTPAFLLHFSDGSDAIIPRVAATHTYTYTLPEGKTLERFTDATAAPGKIIAPEPEPCETQPGDIASGDVGTVAPEPEPCDTQPGYLTPGALGTVAPEPEGE